MISDDRERLTIPPDGRPDEEQPRWRRDFPIDWPADRYLTHRDFIKFLLLISAGFATGQVGLALQGAAERRQPAAPTVEIIREDDIEIGGAMVFHYPDEDTPCLLVRTGERAYLAYEQQCTHLACPVIPRVAEGRLDCPCHEGAFDLATGRPTAGPPRRPLPRVIVEIREGRVWAVGVEKREA